MRKREVSQEGSAQIPRRRLGSWPTITFTCTIGMAPSLSAQNDNEVRRAEASDAGASRAGAQRVDDAAANMAQPAGSVERVGEEQASPDGVASGPEGSQSPKARLWVGLFSEAVVALMLSVTVVILTFLFEQARNGASPQADELAKMLPKMWDFFALKQTNVLEVQGIIVAMVVAIVVVSPKKFSNIASVEDIKREYTQIEDSYRRFNVLQAISMCLGFSHLSLIFLLTVGWFLDNGCSRLLGTLVGLWADNRCALPEEILMCQCSITGYPLSPAILVCQWVIAIITCIIGMTMENPELGAFFAYRKQLGVAKSLPNFGKLDPDKSPQPGKKALLWPILLYWGSTVAFISFAVVAQGARSVWLTILLLLPVTLCSVFVWGSIIAMARSVRLQQRVEKVMTIVGAIPGAVGYWALLLLVSVFFAASFYSEGNDEYFWIAFALAVAVIVLNIYAVLHLSILARRDTTYRVKPFRRAAIQADEELQRRIDTLERRLTPTQKRAIEELVNEEMALVAAQSTTRTGDDKNAAKIGRLWKKLWHFVARQLCLQ